MFKTATRILAMFVLTSAVLVGGHVSHVSADAPKYDVELADFAAHLMVLSPEELPGDGWDTTATDKFEDSSDDIPNTQACKDSALKTKALEDNISSSRAGRAQVELTQNVSAKGPTQVQSTADVYKTADALKGFVDANKVIYQGGAFKDCLLATFKSATNDDGITLKSVDPSSSAPSNGFAVAFEVNLPSIKSTMRFEFYGWSDDNGLFSVSVNGDPSQVKSSLTDQALQSMVISEAIVGAASNTP